MLRQLRREDYTVGWVCALPVELAAAQEMLDEEHQDLERNPTDNDENLYALGSIGGHNIVIVCLPAGRIGNNPAAVVATQLRATFKAIRFGLMVGIGGGVPSAETDIRLGDVVVSQPYGAFGGVVQYDAGKSTISGFKRTGSLNSPPQILLQAVSKVQANEVRGKSRLLEHASRLQRISKFQRSKAGHDILFEAAYEHKSGSTCDRCSPDKREIRQVRESEQEIALHYGTIASGNQAIRSAAERDRVSAELGGVLCFEMEAAGLMNNFPCLVIRGICDYADSHKNKRWQAYAAGTAAAYAKEVLLMIPPSRVEAENKIVDVMSDLQSTAKKHQLIAEEHLDIARKRLKIQHTAREQKLSDQQRECLHLFRLTKSTEDATYEWYKNRVEERVEGTCNWFLQHPHFQEWVKQDSGPLLVSADPGCGKSVLAKYLIDRVLPKLATVCYFFFKEQDQNTVRQALCALLHQLFSQKPALIHHAMKQYEKDGKKLVNSTKSLWTILANAMQDSQSGPVIIVLDALDECAESEFEDLMCNIESQSRGCQSNHSRLKYLLTSRPYEQIVAKFRGLLKSFPRIHIPGEKESEAISQEVNLVISYQVELLAVEKRLPEEVTDNLMTRLTRTEHRTYLWVHLVFDYLRAEVFKKTRKGIEEATKSLPRSVNQAYELILAKSRDQVIVRRALAIIIAANRPLTLSELNLALEIEETTQSVQDLDLENEEDFESRLRTWCGLFVSVHHGKVYFLHQTAREFLLADLPGSTSILQGIKWQHSIAIQDAHKILAECCVRFLSFFNSDANLFADATIKRTNHTANDALLDYAAQFWPMHFRESRFSSSRDATVCHLALTVSNPKSRVFPQWSRIHWKHRPGEDPQADTQLLIASYFGHDTIVQTLLLDQNININENDGHYGNALQAASHGDHEQIVKMLLEKGADVNAQGGHYGNALHAASFRNNEQIVKMLLDKGASVKVQDEAYGNALHAASFRGNVRIVKMLLDKGANVNVQGGNYVRRVHPASYEGNEQVINIPRNKGSSSGDALYTASLRGHWQVVKMLLDKGADVNAQGGQYGNALHAASHGGHEQVVKMLLDKGADVNAQGGQCGNALHAASSGGHEQVVKMLLDKGADINAQGRHFGSALYTASSRGHEQVVKMLLDKGADVNVQGGQYGNALQAALAADNEQIVKMLLDRGADANAQGGFHGNALQEASYRGHEKIVKMLLDKGADVNAQGGFHGNALQTASFQGNEQIVKILLDRGADVNAQGERYGNALHIALREGHEQIVKILLDMGADINAQGGEYGSVLNAASVKGNKQIVKILLDRGADVNTQSERYGNALQAASRGGHEQIVQIMLDKGVDVNAQGGDLGNALQEASFGGNEQVVKILLDKGADVNAQGGVYGNALQAALQGGHEQIAKMLLNRGADINTQGGLWGGALQAALQGGHEQMVKILFDKGVDVNVQGGFYGNALQAASEKGNKQVVKILLDKGANVNAQGGLHGNALQAASHGDHEQIVKMLLDKGADVNAQGGHCGNALRAALQQGNEKVAKLLLDAGALQAQGDKLVPKVKRRCGGRRVAYITHVPI